MEPRESSLRLLLAELPSVALSGLQEERIPSPPRRQPSPWECAPRVERLGDLRRKSAETARTSASNGSSMPRSSSCTPAREEVADRTRFSAHFWASATSRQTTVTEVPSGQ